MSFKKHISLLKEALAKKESILLFDTLAKKLAQDIVELLSPKWLRIGGYWYPRGGIPIDIFWQTCKQPNDLFIPDHLVPNYRGRG